MHLASLAATFPSFPFRGAGIPLGGPGASQVETAQGQKDGPSAWVCFEDFWSANVAGGGLLETVAQDVRGDVLLALLVIVADHDGDVLLRAVDLV